MSGDGPEPRRIDPPEEFLEASVDPRGRVRIPDRLYEFLQQFGDQQYFITSFDLEVVRIYPLTIWKRNVELLENATQDAESGHRLLFLARLRGHTTSFDTEQRLLLPLRLRQQMGLERQRVYLQWFRGHLELMTPQYVSRHEAESQLTAKTDLKLFQEKGLL